MGLTCDEPFIQSHQIVKVVDICVVIIIEYCTSNATPLDQLPVYIKAIQF